MRTGHMMTLVAGLMIAGSVLGGWCWSPFGQSTAASDLAVATQEPLRRWEYKVVEEFDNLRLERELNRLGDSGFEVTEFEIVNQAGSAPRKVLILKRPRP